ncbi:MAG: cell division protein ZipA [Wenzhouxiangella sp.]
MDNLRLILMIVGLIILAAIVLLHKPKGQSQPNHARWRQARREPSLGESEEPSMPPIREASDESEADALNTQASFPALDKQARQGTTEPVPARAKSEPAVRADKPPAAALPDSPDKIVTLYIRRREERRIGGSDLLDAAVKAGLSFGEMSIFHRRQEGADKPVFSMANLSPPGHFDSTAWNVFDTPGVTLFATLPGPLSALDAWDAMLATGSRIAELLEADLLDDAKCLLTRQRIGQIREEMREYDRVHGLSSY